MASFWQNEAMSLTTKRLHEDALKQGKRHICDMAFHTESEQGQGLKELRQIL